MSITFYETVLPNGNIGITWKENEQDALLWRNVLLDIRKTPINGRKFLRPENIWSFNPKSKAYKEYKKIRAKYGGAIKSYNYKQPDIPISNKPSGDRFDVDYNLHANNSDLVPIETPYKGYKFRSRLEAKWAVFLDCLKIEWEYEAEGYKLDENLWYLPDFYLRTLHAFAEVKPMKLSDRDLLKASLLARKSKIPVLLFVGSPEYIPYDIITSKCDYDKHKVDLDCSSHKLKLWWVSGDEMDNPCMSPRYKEALDTSRSYRFSTNGRT